MAADIERFMGEEVLSGCLAEYDELQGETRWPVVPWAELRPRFDVHFDSHEGIPGFGSLPSLVVWSEHYVGALVETTSEFYDWTFDINPRNPPEKDFVQ